eukprot:m.709465 g.709465  ORF g.709465 m.709465 type:complete len:66 (-) comp22944_c0_seq10:2053-2250(-)
MFCQHMSTQLVVWHSVDSSSSNHTSVSSGSFSFCAGATHFILHVAQRRHGSCVSTIVLPDHAPRV